MSDVIISQERIRTYRWSSTERYLGPRDCCNLSLNGCYDVSTAGNAFVQAQLTRPPEAAPGVSLSLVPVAGRAKSSARWEEHRIRGSREVASGAGGCSLCWRVGRFGRLNDGQTGPASITRHVLLLLSRSSTVRVWDVDSQRLSLLLLLSLRRLLGRCDWGRGSRSGRGRLSLRRSG